MTERIDVCPACDSPEIRSRSQSDWEWHCRACKAKFDAPAERAPKFRGDQTEPKRGLAARLAAMDAGEVTADE